MAQADSVFIASYARFTDANPSTAPADCSVRVAYTKLLTALADHPPSPIPVDADCVDLQDRAAHLNAVFGGLAAYLAIVLDDTAQNAPGGLELADAEASLPILHPT